MMKEIGGYIELDTYHLPMLHEGAIALNCGRNALAYLFKSRGIRKLKVPYFICDSVLNVCDREGVGKDYYHIDSQFRPMPDLSLADDEWLYLVNYYGQLKDKEISRYVYEYKRVIVDQAQGFFEKPIPGADTLYTCRKWFGVADGAFLYTDAALSEEFPQDESFDRMRFLLGRYERPANEFYAEYNGNNKYFLTEPIKRMSKLTQNLLHGIDYKAAEQKRAENFVYLHERLGDRNGLDLITGTFMYPFLVENGSFLRQRLRNEKIYIPTLWPSVFEITEPDDLEYKMAKNILPLPIDQRYGIDDMNYMAGRIQELGGNKDA